MRRTTTGFYTKGFFVMCLTAALAGGGGCKGKEGGGGGGGGGGGTNTTKKPPKKDKPAGPVVFDMAARKKIADNATYTKRELYKSMVKKIPEVAETCRKAKKYATSLSWCEQFKALRKEADAVFKEMKSSEPKTVRRGMAIIAACAKHLKDESLFVRYTALELINGGIYRLAWGKADAEAKDIRRMLAWVYKKDADKSARKKAINILGGTGGVSGWRGDAQDARVLFYAASKDADKYVRGTALSRLRYCVKKPAACPLTPKMVKAWYEKESYDSNKQTIADIAGRLKMAKEVLSWCKGFLVAGKLRWGCTYGLGFIANKDTAAEILGMANAYRDSDTSKKKNDYGTKYLAEVMVAGVKHGFPKDKAVAFLLSVLKQPETVSLRGASTASYIVRHLAYMAKGKDEAKKWGKLIKKAQKRYKKAWSKDKYKKSYLKSFADSLKRLKDKSA